MRRRGRCWAATTAPRSPPGARRTPSRPTSAACGWRWCTTRARCGRGARLRRRYPHAELVVFGHSHIPVDQDRRVSVISTRGRRRTGAASRTGPSGSWTSTTGGWWRRGSCPSPDCICGVCAGLRLRVAGRADGQAPGARRRGGCVGNVGEPRTSARGRAATSARPPPGAVRPGGALARQIPAVSMVVVVVVTRVVVVLGEHEGDGHDDGAGRAHLGVRHRWHVPSRSPRWEWCSLQLGRCAQPEQLELVGGPAAPALPTSEAAATSTAGGGAGVVGAGDGLLCVTGGARRSAAAGSLGRSAGGAMGARGPRRQCQCNQRRRGDGSDGRRRGVG